ncbi:Histidinol-phosphate aminotransferase [Pigmentiphaga humi]|uniref:Histidinol-phosphate aminotransferase n=1 Tax=Pigmentiphaga humi TaxID=2478468 RepID=A0A3P4B8J8_9BURK|nr:histidinol-phosphate transaminase [Pigmentiphaga humi]VCU71950.1 Histidinol-phosphate aminotransferase [Pigmentiphaga humi]
MNRYWSRVTQQLTPYVPGEQPKIDGLVKLNTNENPYPPSPRALEAIRHAAGEALRLYPDPDATVLKTAVARFHGVAPDHIFAGNSSDEVLAHVFAGLLKHDLPLLFPDVTYSFYPVYCGLFGIEYRTVPLDDGLGLRVQDYAQPNGGIILPNPNAPTGRLLPLADIEALLQAHPDSVVVIDEAYIDFGGESAVPLVARHPNLLVVQTLSKSRSLAGLRVGYAIGQPHLIEGLERVKSSFNSYPLDRLALAGAAAAMDDVAYFDQTRQAIIASRGRLTEALQGLGFEVLPSAANFVFARHPGHAGAALLAALRERKVLVRHFEQPRIRQYLRITVGTDAECDTLVAALREIVG